METSKKVWDKRKLLLIVPALLLPLMAVAFYALGGGKGANPESELSVRGMNTLMPDASLKTEPNFDKMGFYANQEQDSLEDHLEKVLPNDLDYRAGGDTRAVEIEAKLAALNKELNAPVQPVNLVKPDFMAKDGIQMKADVDRLEHLMNSMKSNQAQDPELQQMNGLLEKILEIQNPSRAQTDLTTDSKFSAFWAKVDGNQKVSQGATVKLRLMDSVQVEGLMLPKGQLLFGQARIVSQRLLLDIKNVRLGNQIIPVNLSVFALDGMAGIDAPDAVLGNAVGMGAENLMGGISVYGLEGVSGQMVGAGMDAAKSLLSKKVRVISVKLKDNLPVLLKLNK